ncbi:hypothetical protein Tco_1080953 [Tanacetum coccineum]|uniref:Uncharacterized protein n=1 Tax=Tanacetum coccineum TaxID=301880 RepID=A0ABQ5HY48_9ASTR
MVTYLDVLCLGMIYWVLHNADCAFIINVDFGIHEIETIVQQLILKNPSPTILVHMQFAADTYSDSVTPKISHLNAVKRIFKYLKGKPHLGLWYPRESPFDLEAFSDSDYGGSNMTGFPKKVVSQFLGQRLISWQCKKQTIVATSTTEAEHNMDGKMKGQRAKVLLLYILREGTSGRHKSNTRFEAATKLSPGCTLLSKVIDNGRRYKRRKETKGKKVVSRLDFQEEVDTGAEQVNTAEGVNTASIKLNTGSDQVSTGSEQVSTVGAKKSTPSPDKGQRAGKAPMISEETPKKSKEQILQEEASLAEAIRLDSLQKEEVAKQVHLDSLLAQRIAEEEELNEQQKKRKAMFRFEVSALYTDEDWICSRAKIEANAELSKSIARK